MAKLVAIPNPVAEGEQAASKVGTAEGVLVRFHSDGTDELLIENPLATRALIVGVQHCEEGGEPAESVPSSFVANNLGVILNVPGVVVGEEYLVTILAV